MRIAVISTLSSGGAAIAALRTTEALRKFGHECTFFVLEPGQQPGLVALREEVLYSQSHFAVPYLFSQWKNLVTAQAMQTACSELFSDQFLALHMGSPVPEALAKADIIHLHWAAGVIFSPALLHAMQGKKVVWTLHDMNAFTGGCHYHATCRNFERECDHCPMLLHSGPGDASARSFQMKQRIYPLLAPSIVTPSHWLGVEARRSTLLCRHPATVIPHCLDMEVFRPLERGIQRREFGLKEDSFVVLVGADSVENPRKNLGVAFEALASLAERNLNNSIEVLAYGHGAIPAMPFPVKHLGHIADEESMAAAYNAADIYVQPSLLDNLPNTLCEAQCCGTPVLTFDSGGCKEALIPGKTGFVVGERNAAALADALVGIITDRAILGPMRIAAREFALEHFSQEKSALAYTELYNIGVAAAGVPLASPLGQDLLQNQIASLASHFRAAWLANQEHFAMHELRLCGIESTLPQLNERISIAQGELQEQIAHLQLEIDYLGQALRHPLRWFFRKFRKKMRIF